MQGRISPRVGLRKKSGGANFAATSGFTRPNSSIYPDPRCQAVRPCRDHSRLQAAPDDTFVSCTLPYFASTLYMTESALLPHRCDFPDSELIHVREDMAMIALATWVLCLWSSLLNTVARSLLMDPSVSTLPPFLTGKAVQKSCTMFVASAASGLSALFFFLIDFAAGFAAGFVVVFPIFVNQVCELGWVETSVSFGVAVLQ